MFGKLSQQVKEFREKFSSKVTSPQILSICEGLFQIKVILSDLLPKTNLNYILNLFSTIDQFLEITKTGNFSDIPERYLKIIAKQTSNLLKRINRKDFQKNPVDRVNSAKSSISVITLKLQKFLETPANTSKSAKKKLSFTPIFNIFQAIEGNNLDKVKQFVDKNINILQKGDSMGNLPIHEAVKHNKKEIVEYLLDQNCLILKYPNKTGLTPLELSISHDNFELVKIICNYIDPNTVDLKYTLHCTEEIAEYLFKKFPKQINLPIPDRDRIKNKSKQTPLHKIAAQGDIDILECSLNNGGNPNVEDINLNTPIMSCIFNDNPDVIETLVTYGGDIDQGNIDGDTPIHAAASIGNKETFNKVIEVGADVNSINNKSETALHKVIGRRDDNLTKNEILDTLLSQPDIDVNQENDDGYSPVIQAAEKNDTEIVEKILQVPSVDVNVTSHEGFSALTFSVINDNQEIAKQILAKGGKTELKNVGGKVPLHYVSSRDMVETLVSGGADINAEDDNKQNVLFTVIGEGLTDTAIAAIEKGAKVDHKDIRNSTPLQESAKAGNDKIMDVILNVANENLSEFDNAADFINNIDENGATALHYAASSNNKNSVDMILSTDVADLDVKDCNNNTAMDTTNLPEIKQKITEKKINFYGGKQGALVFGLTWADWNDLDIHLLCACGSKVDFSNKSCEHCELDVDMNVNGGSKVKDDKNSEDPVEHISFEHFPPDGTYSVDVNLYSQFETDKNSKFTVYAASQNDNKSNEIIFFVESEFPPNCSYNTQTICKFTIENKEIISISAPTGNVYQNKIEGVSKLMSREGEYSTEIPSKYLPKRVEINAITYEEE